MLGFIAARAQTQSAYLSSVLSVWSRTPAVLAVGRSHPARNK